MDDDPLADRASGLYAKWRRSTIRAISRITEEFRTSSLRRWAELRQRVRSESFQIEDAAIARLHSEDVGLEFGLVALKDGRAFAFEFEFLRDASGNRLQNPGGEAWVSEWRELDEYARQSTYARELEVARDFLEGRLAADSGP